MTNWMPLDQIVHSKVLENVPDHRGEVRSKNVVFFAPPPSEIGALTTADSSFRVGKSHIPLIIRFLIAISLNVVVLLFYLHFNGRLDSNSDRAALRLLAIFSGVVLFAATFYLTRFSATCSYVGDKGIARYSIYGSRSAKPIQEILVFAIADELHSSQTREYINGCYIGTKYSYTWTDYGGNIKLKLYGKYQGHKSRPKKGDPWYFAHAAEVVWSEHFVRLAVSQLEKNGYIEFRVDKKRSLRIGPGFIQFNFGDDIARVNLNEIGDVSLNGGYFSFKHKDAKWYSRAGKFSFQYGGMANARVFLLSLEKLMGISWQ